MLYICKQHRPWSECGVNSLIRCCTGPAYHEPLSFSWLIIQQTTSWWIIFIFPRKQDLAFHANCLQQFAWNVKSCWRQFAQNAKSYLKTISMKCQILFSGENKKNIWKCPLLKNLARMLIFKQDLYFGFS